MKFILIHGWFLQQRKLNSIQVREKNTSDVYPQKHFCASICFVQVRAVYVFHSALVRIGSTSAHWTRYCKRKPFSQSAFTVGLWVKQRTTACM